MTDTRHVTLNRDVELDDGLVIPAETTGTQLGHPNLLHGRDAATVRVDFGPPIGVRVIPYPAVTYPPFVGDLWGSMA